MTDLHDPFSNKYAKWKIVDYLWACFLEELDKGVCLDWLKDQYKQMTEEEKSKFTHEIELIYLVMERCPNKFK